MTLDDYTQASSKDSFTYCDRIAARRAEQGSIWGGSSFKFGVLSRKDAEVRESAENRSYSDTTHGWYSALGATAEEAFEKVRGYVGQIVALAANGDLAGIEAFDHLGEATKGEIACHHQNRQTPVILNIFKKAPLERIHRRHGKPVDGLFAERRAGPAIAATRGRWNRCAKTAPTRAPKGRVPAD